ncbi:MAG TPA: SPOR domain-containing protein [Rhodocyclaceae bacterium]|nr:SPOR domain-containing protein [Rhodocyclaceae bacterium]
MLMKLFFVLVVALFGALMFVTGVMAPEKVKIPVARTAQKVMASLPLQDAPQKEAAKPANDNKKDADPPVAAETLLLPTPLPAQGQYALQLGQFGNADAADILLQRVQAAGITAKRIAAVDRSGQTWWIVAAGSYGQPDEARSARATMAKEVGAGEGMPVILLPAGPASPAPASAAPTAQPASAKS